MTTAQLIVVATAVGIAAMVQMIAGFGFGLLAMPIMTLALPVETAVVVSTLLGVVSTNWQGWYFRADARRPLVRRLTLAAFVGMPLGLVVLNVVSDQALKVTLGCIVLVATLLLARRIDMVDVGHRFDYVSGFLSGLLNTSLSTNGPPLVFNLQARRLAADEFRATIAMVFALSNLVGLSLFLANGKVTLDGVKAALIAVPAWAVGLSIGLPLRRHMHGERFRVMVLALLFVTGAGTIVFALT